ncbi:nucleoprotein TPR-like isoform X1 [Corythoichthys intestinalis]|uniref:nucleoprotein TPR-like isoform X1 n=1 Tax=Corythoichthys intestinalis TaxID=161448 RepID=UPI0025A65724|nr:nucleoprotein TPR-like isoform X1 [Corythoichthys intestinalis]
MAAVLLQVLERTELNKLPKGVQNKLEKFVSELQNANEALLTQQERFKANSEQQFFDIDKKLGESQEQILCATRDLQTLKEENKKLNEELSVLKGIEGDTSEVKTEQQQSKSKYELEAEKRELARLLEKRTQEVENLTEDAKRLNERLVETNKVKVELQLKLDELQSSQASVQHREKRMEQEKELLDKKIEWLTAELKTKTEELLNSNRETGKEILVLKGNLKSKTEQVTRLESQLSSLNQSSENQNKRAEDLNNKLKQAKDELSSMEEKYRNELNAHVKLSSLYKGVAADMETKNQELSRAVEELSKLVKNTAEANKMLEKKVSDAEEQKTRSEVELNDKIKKMEKELENASLKASGKYCCAPSLTEEQLESMCPSAAAIAAIVKPGMKFFDLYNAYSECQTQLQLEKQETRRVSKVLDEVVQEVECKAPVLRRQREEFETMQSSMASLWNKLEQARTEIYSLQKEKDEAKQHCDNLEKAKLRTERLLDDTSTQVCALLVELEEARGNPVTKDEGSAANISGTGARPHQVSFRSVEELQMQNRSLLERLKKLEEENTNQQIQAKSTRVLELETSVDKLQKELEQLSEQGKQQKQLADSNARQRDMYKALLSHTTGFTLPSQDFAYPPPARPSAPVTRSTPLRVAAESAQTSQAKAALKQLNDAFTLYKKEKAENDKMLNDSHDRLERQLTEARSSNAKLTSQLEFSNKRYEMLQETVTAFRRETSALQNRNQKIAATVQRLEHIVHTMSQDLRQANEKLALEEVRVENLTKERDMLKQVESRLNREKEAMLAEQRNQNLLLTNLKTIQLTMERTDTEIRQRLNSKIENLETELASMKTRLEKEVAQRHTLGRNMDAQLIEAKKQLESQNTLQLKTRELLKNSEQQLVALKAQLASTSTEGVSTPVTRAATLRTPVRVRSPVQTTQQAGLSELAEVKSNLNAAEEQINKLAEQLKNANATVEQYRAVVLTLEDSLKNEKEQRAPLEMRLKESEDIQKKLESQILEVEKKNEQAQQEKRKALETVEKQVSDLQRSLKASQAEQQEALERAAKAVTLEQKAIQESLLQTKQAGEAQAKYERELMLHAADVEVLKELKKTLQEEAVRNKDLEEQLNKSNSSLQEKAAAWTTLEKQLKDELAAQSGRCEELGKQNTLLHEQMDEMAARSRQQQPEQQQLNFSFSEEGKTLEQIQEILRFVRKEKEIAVARGEASEGEALRYKQRVEHQNRELKELQEALNAEREKMQTTVKKLAQKETQLKNMGNISTLQETNKMLKMEREKLGQELQQTQAKVKKLESNISPLHDSLAHLSDRNGSLQADKKLLEDDIKHLKAKIQQLVSQQKDGDVEEKQKLTAEREAQQRRISQLVEEAAKLKTELARSSTSNNLAQSQVKSLRESLTRLTAERDTLKKELGTKNSDILEKNKTITQVKKIGRRYKTQYEELKALHDKLVVETGAKTQGETSQVGQQQLSKSQEELNKVKEELATLKESMQEAKNSQQELQNAQKENQQIKEKLEDIQNQLTQNQNQLTQAQSQLTQTQSQLQQSQKELQQSKTHIQQLQNQLKSSQCQAQARQNQIQLMQKEIQQAKDSHQQNLTSQKKLQETHQQELNHLKTSLSKTESQASELQGQVDTLNTMMTAKEAENKKLQEQLAEVNQANEALKAAQVNQNQNLTNQASEDNAEADTNAPLQMELGKLRQELSESKNKEEQLRQQMADKEEKTKKAFVGAKTKINQLITAKENLSKEVEELKQSKEELEVRMNALKSQYEGRLLRLDRELRENQTLTEPREEPQDQSGSKIGDQNRSLDQRPISLKSPAQDRSSSSLSEPPTANIRPTPSTPSPSNKPTPAPGSKSTPRASIRPMVTPAAVPMPTPTATVMPTTQTESQEVLTAGATAHTVISSLNTLTSITQPTSTQATAFVQPTQQQATSQDVGSSIDAERPSTSSAVIGASSSKRSREDDIEEEEIRPESSHASSTAKKLRLRQAILLQVEGHEDMEDLGDESERQDSPDNSQELPEDSFPVIPEDDDIEEEGMSQSVPSDRTSPEESGLTGEVIVIDTDSESRESRGEKPETTGQEEDQAEEEDEEEEEEGEEVVGEDDNDDDDEDDEEGSNLAIKEGDEGQNEDGDAEEEGQRPSATSADESDSQCPPEPSHSSEASSNVESESQREAPHFPPTSSPATASPSSSSLTLRLPQPRRPPHPLPPRLYIQPPASELGPPHAQARQSSQLRRPSVGRGPQLTPGIGSMQHFFDDDDRMVPSTPTLVVPHRTDGFAEAIHSPQVAGLSTRFRFGPPEDLLPQSSASHSDLGQLASQGGLGMYESPLFLPAHDEDGGGRSVPTTPLQVAAPVTVFTESLPSDSGDNMASQSVPMVTASTAIPAPGDDVDEVFMEQEESTTAEASLDSHTDMEAAGQQSEDASLPSTSQDPDSSTIFNTMSNTSSVTQRRAVTSQPVASTPLSRTRGRGEGRMLISRRGTVGRSRGGLGRGSSN